MEEAGPAKWHLAHTTWFVEQFVLREHVPDYRSPDDRFAYLFNSYYGQAGPRHAAGQPRRAGDPRQLLGWGTDGLDTSETLWT
jgi:hypothetical protein